MDVTSDRVIAVVGLGAVLPDARNVDEFWTNVTSGRYSISDVPADRWDPELYYDPDPKAPDKTYSRIGGWVRACEWEPVKWRLPIPPRVADAMDWTQKWAIGCTLQALSDYGYPSRALDVERTAVILGNAMGGELHNRTTLRTTFPEVARELETVPAFAALSPEVRSTIRREWHASLGRKLPPVTEDSMPGELSNCIAGRLANLLNFRGPNFVVDAACASAMAAMSAAVEGLLEKRFDAVITGGVDRNMGAPTFIKFCKIGALSATGSRPYADGADGFVMGEGAAIFLMKRLADAERDGDRIYAVLRGVGGSSDGKGKGITAPNPVGQRLAVTRAWENAGLSPAGVGLIEGHGTSTAVGDLVEVQSLIDVFAKAGCKPGSVALGSVKSNIGHLKSSAGAAGVLKAVLSLHHKVLPPTANFEKPNRGVDFAASPFRVATELRPWELSNGHPRQAGVSAFGFGGTNFHVVLEEHVPGRFVSNGRTHVALDPAPSGPAGGPGVPATTGPSSTGSGAGLVGVPGPTGGPTVADNGAPGRAPLRGALLLGGPTVQELAERLRSVAAEARAGTAPAPAPPSAADLKAMERVCIDYGNAAELAEKAARAAKALESGVPALWKALRAQGVFRGHGAPGKVAFLYTGQGSQYLNMLKTLVRTEPVVADTFAEADRHTVPLLGRPISDYLFVDPADTAAMARAEEELRQTAITQPAVLTADIALTRLLGAYGVRPDMVMGHSLGEYGALVACGAMPFRDALEAVSARGREMTRVSMADNGWMVAVFAPLAEIERIVKSVDGEVVIANINSTSQAVIGGASAPVERAMKLCQEAGYTAMRLPVSHAFHTSIVAPASGPLAQQLRRLHLEPPRIPIVSNVTGGFYPMGPDVVPEMVELLAKQVASPVQFVKGLRTLFDAGARLFVETGPKKALHGFAEDAFADRADTLSLFTNHPKFEDRLAFNQALCGAYAMGHGAPRPASVPLELATRPAVPALVSEPSAEPEQASWQPPSGGSSNAVEAGSHVLGPADAGSHVVDRTGAESKPRADVSVSPVNTPASQTDSRTHERPEGAMQPGTTGNGLSADQVMEIGRLFASAIEHGLDVYKEAAPAPDQSPVVVTGASLGLPGTPRVFDDGNVARIMRGEIFLKAIPDTFRHAMAEKRITRLVKSADGMPRFEMIDKPADVVKLAARPGELDLVEEFGVPADRLPALDPGTRLAIGAGLEALRDAGIPLVQHYKTTTKGTLLPDRWGLPDDLRDETGVIFTAAFPGLDSFVEIISGFYRDRWRREKVQLLDDLRHRMNGEPRALREAIESQIRRTEAELEREPYVFDRRFLLRVLPMGHSQFAELIGARGPNTQINSACASSTMALGLAEDWIRAGRCRRVIVVGADNITSDNLIEWFGAGFLASGAAATDEKVEDAALPFDRRRHGLLIGMGAAGVVVESPEAARERGLQPICEVIETVSGNSAFHGTRLDVQHISGLMEHLIARVEAKTGVPRKAIAERLVFVSHETYTPARGGSASAEVTALRRVFGDDVQKIVVANSKGYTGHPMAVGIEDVMAIKSLETGIVPPVAHYKEVDPELGPLNLSRGGPHPVEWAMRLAAGFGSQISLSVMRWTPMPDGARRAPDALGYAYRVVDRPAWNEWLRRVSGQAAPELEVVRRTLRVKEQPGATARPAAGSAALAAVHPTPAAMTINEAPSEAARAAARAMDAMLLDLRRAIVERDFFPREVDRAEAEKAQPAVACTVCQPGESAGSKRSTPEPKPVSGQAGTSIGSVLEDAGAVPRDVTPVMAGHPETAAAVHGGTAVVPAAAAVVASAAGAVTESDPVKERILALVVEKTGYPAEMLDLDLDLEADLGVDTVKQAELMAAIRGSYDIPRDDKLKLRDFPTLNHVITFVYDRRPDLRQAQEPAIAQVSSPASADQSATQALVESRAVLEQPAHAVGHGVTAATPQAAATAAVAQSATPSTAGDAVKDNILALVVEKTGYPAEMLDLDLDLEADLGVDTVKQAELMAAIRGLYGIPRDDRLKLRDFPTLNHVIQFVYDRRPDLQGAQEPALATASNPVIAEQSQPAVAESAETLEQLTPVVADGPGAMPAADQVKDTILALVVEKTGYPAEMLDLELDLEADLGIDTVKQAELMAAIRGLYDIPRDDRLKLRDFPTLNHVIMFVYDRRPDLYRMAQAPGPEPIGSKTDSRAASGRAEQAPVVPGSAAAAQPPVPAVEAGVGAAIPAQSAEPVGAHGVVAVPAADLVKDKILALVVEKTGYPAEMLDLDLDLEADLGVDTVKQAELMAAIRGLYDIPRDDRLKLRDFPTLKHVIQFVYDRRPDLRGVAQGVGVATPEQPAGVTQGPAPVTTGQEEPAQPAHAGAAVSARRAAARRADIQPMSFDAANKIPRRVPTPMVRPPLAFCRPSRVSLGAGRRVLVMADHGGAALELGEELRGRGVTPLLMPAASSDERFDAQLAAWLAAGPITGVYWLPALDVEAEPQQMTFDEWREAVRGRVKLLYRAMRTLYQHMDQEEAFLVAATRCGGQHGYDAPGALSALAGAVTGFTKAFKRERSWAVVKAVDFADESSADIARLLVDETLRDPGVVEIGYRDGVRWTVGLTEQSAADGRPGMTLSKDSVFVVTGAAGSIVSAIVADLAAASGGVFYLLDRVPEPDPDNPDFARFGNDKEGLKLEIAARLKARGERVTPVVVERELAAIERGCAALQAVRAVEECGGIAIYTSVDLMDPAAVSGAIETVREQSGRIDVLVHAAGIEISRFLPEKEPAEFDRVFDVKANGWFNLLHAIGDMPLGAAVVFSSIAGRFGNGGQTDYSAANDLLCKSISTFRRCRPDTRGIAIDWTAWSGIGMASRGSIPKMMELAGIDMLPPEAGVPIVRRELTEGATSGEIVVADRLGVMLEEFDPVGVDAEAAAVRERLEVSGPMIGRIVKATPSSGLFVETTLDPNVQPFLFDHQIEGTPVLPGVMGVEAFAELAHLLLPEYHVVAIEDVRFQSAFKFFRHEPRAVRLHAHLIAHDDGVVVTCQLIGVRAIARQAAPQETVHFTGRVRLAREPLALETSQPPVQLVDRRVSAPDIYRIYFHGPAFQVLESAWRDRDTVVGRFAKRLPPSHVPGGRHTLMAPRLIELAFQAAGLWDIGTTGRMSLPYFIESVAAFEPAEPADTPLFAVVRRDPARGVFDAEVVDTGGQVFVRLRGYQTVEVPGVFEQSLMQPLVAAMAASGREIGGAMVAVQTK